MKIKRFFIEYFTMNKMQQSGTIVLLCLIIIVALLPRFVAFYKSNRHQPDFAKFDSIMASYEPMPAESYAQQPPKVAVVPDSIFTFDPNTATYDDFLCLGLSERISANIVKYRKSGGTFKTPADFSKIYGITDSVYAALLPYIKITTAAKPAAKTKRATASKSTKPETKKSRYQPAELPVVELNTADSAQLDALRGIGPVLAKRIITYREMLGGFHTVEQLREIRNLSAETYADLYIQFTIDSSKIRKIDLNNFEYKELKRHPYMPVAQLNSIMNYLRLMGRFKSVDELLKHKLVDTLTYQKISPYLEAN